MTLLKTIRFVLPTLLFGYAIAANLHLVTAAPAMALPRDDLLSGGLTRDFDGLYRKDLWHRSWSVGLVGAARYVFLGEGRDGVIVGSDGWLFTAEEARTMPEGTGDLNGSVAGVTAIRDRLKAAGTELVIVPLPAKIDIAAVHAPDALLGPLMAMRHAAFMAGLAKAGITTVDARTPLIAAGDDAPTFFATDTHWTPEGATAVAQAVAASGMVTHGSQAFTVMADAEKPLIGDLVGFVTTAALAPQLGLRPETVTPYTVVPATGADTLSDLLGDTAAEAVLVGTSYSANSDWGFNAALMLALGRDVVSMAAPGQGPVAPMLRYLDSPAFRDAPPQVVIWEFPVRALSDPALWAPAPDTVEGETSNG